MAADTAAATIVSDRADRAAFVVVAVLTGALALLTTADGIWRTIALAVGDGPVQLLASGEVVGNTGWVTTATVVSSELGELPRSLLVVTSALSLLIAITIYVAVVAFLVSTIRGTPFHRRLFPLVVTTGALMSIGGILAAGVDGLARMMAGGELGAPYVAGFELSLGPWAFGFIVLVAAFVLRAGNRLQRDTEGLV